MLDFDTPLQSPAAQAQLASELIGMLAGAAEPPGAAELEHLAAMLLVTFEEPERGPQAGVPLVDTLAESAGPGALGLLVAFAALAREPLNAHAEMRARSVSDRGVVCPDAASIGTLSIDAAARVEGDGAELITVVLGRPGSDERQLAVFGIDWAETGGAVINCDLHPPQPAAVARDLLAGVNDAPAPEPLDPEEVRRRVTTALRRSVELEIPFEHDSATAMPIVSRALTGSPSELPRPAVLPPRNDDDDAELVVDAAEDQDGFDRVVEMLLDELEQYARPNHAPDGVVWAHGDFVASTMLEWKGTYGDGRLGRWTRADLAEFLLDYFPRKVTVRPDTVAAVPECILGFLGFLAARGSLSGEPIDACEAVLDLMRPEFEERMADRSNWGLAKSLAMRMQSEGIDPSEAGAFEAWIANFNARPDEERDAIVGPATDRMLGSLGAASGARTHDGKTRQRKAQKAARKKNRRR